MSKTRDTLTVENSEPVKITPPDSKNLPNGISLSDVAIQAALPDGGKVILVKSSKTNPLQHTMIHISAQGNSYALSSRQGERLTIDINGQYAYQWTALSNELHEITCLNLWTHETALIPFEDYNDPNV
jgi:hypothetical protein